MKVMYILGRFVGKKLFTVLPVVFLAACGGGGGSSSTSSLPKGDPVNGKELYEQCTGCHMLTENSIGPRHCGLFGRQAGTVPEFKYSSGMVTSGVVWNEETLDEFLMSPLSYIHGTMMGFAGISDATQRADVIAYLREANEDPTVCPM